MKKIVKEANTEPKQVNGNAIDDQNKTHKMLLFSEPGASNNITDVSARNTATTPIMENKILDKIAKRFIMA